MSPAAQTALAVEFRNVEALGRKFQRNEGKMAFLRCSNRGVPAKWERDLEAYRAAYSVALEAFRANIAGLATEEIVAVFQEAGQ